MQFLFNNKKLRINNIFVVIIILKVVKKSQKCYLVRYLNEIV